MNHSENRRGHTLLELILALSLTILVVLSIATAIRLYMMTLTEQQRAIERKQIARAVVEMISNDLRAGIQYKAADYSDLENLVATQLTSQNIQLPAPGSEEEESSGEQEEPEPVVDEEQVSFRPTLLGTSDFVLLDISRLPRLDQYNPLVANQDAEVQSPSDIKSLAYFVSFEASKRKSDVKYSQSVAPGGLYRREIDRAVASFRGDTNIMRSPDEFAKLIAGEIAQLRFRYFDGEEWQTEWDSTENGGFPPAIEITLVLDPSRMFDGQNYSYAGFDQQNMESYRSVVHLPAAEVMPEEETQ